MSPSSTESVHAGEFLITEGNGDISRQEITVVSGQNLVAGAVLGKITASGKYTAYANAGVAGEQAAAGILYDAVDASAADAAGVAIVRHAEVDSELLNWGAEDAAAQTAGIADLLALDVLVR